jgi:hypothetical protein
MKLYVNIFDINKKWWLNWHSSNTAQITDISSNLIHFLLKTGIVLSILMLLTPALISKYLLIKELKTFDVLSNLYP